MQIRIILLFTGFDIRIHVNMQPTFYLHYALQIMFLGSPGFAVKGCRIWGCERAYARPHPQIRVSTTGIPKEPVSYYYTDWCYDNTCEY